MRELDNVIFFPGQSRKRPRRRRGGVRTSLGTIADRVIEAAACGELRVADPAKSVTAATQSTQIVLSCFEGRRLAAIVRARGFAVLARRIEKGVARTRSANV